MKRPVLLFLILIAIGILYSAWNIFGPVVSSKEKYFYIHTGSGYEQVKNDLLDKRIIPNAFFFDRIAKQVKYDKRIRPGRYEIKEGINLVNLVRMLKRGNQAPVKLVINKLRTKEDFAAKIGAGFETDSAAVMGYITSNDTLKQWHLDTNTVMTTVIPDTYEILWNTPFKKIFSRLRSEHEKFWNAERIYKSQKKKLTTTEVYTLASIVEEETNQQEDKGLIASVYLNRLKKGMKLEADPTVKYAMRNFALKRILHGHLDYPSAYNTYRNTGLPPGPIATPSSRTIDAVLDAPETDYIFFVAKPDFKGRSNFAATYQEHLIFARAYQRALDSLILSKNQN
ncbi:MAG TPA: endolytic transglycosylase MltG [Ferruginibacter sp.]|nr:endolytic transglycosylase MltG [Ferruginibacter sp.]